MQVLTRFGVPISMRDGTELVADVYLPDIAGPMPAILMRTPYGRAMALTYPRELYGGLRFVKDGYALVLQDTRGRFDSAGSFYPFRHETADGVDTIAWTVRQPWSNGRVAMIGGSYSAATQWLPASENPPGLAAIAPSLTAADYRDGWIYRNGAFELGFSLDWALRLCLDSARRRVAEGSGPANLVERVLDARDRVESLYRELDDDAEDLLGELAPYYLDWRAHPERDAAWPSIAPDPRPEATIAPALDIGGWYDIFLVGTLANFRRQRDAALAAGRPGPRLIVGPWAHEVFTGTFAGRRFGTRSAIDVSDIAAEQVRWFDRWVRGRENGVEHLPPVRLFVMGRDAWQDFADWPPPNLVPTDFYLRTSGNGGPGSAQEGGLAITQRDAEQAPDKLVFDPASPVPTAGGATLFAGSGVGERAGPVDMADLERRSDVLTYTSTPLERAMTLVGPVELRIRATASSRGVRSGFDLAAHLTDVTPNGRSELLTGGILRVGPGATEDEVVIALGATAARIGPGHRIRVDLAASDFPRFDLNPSATAAGGAIVCVGGPANSARLVLPVLPDAD